MFKLINILTFILLLESISCVELGKLTIGKTGDLNAVQLKSNNPSKPNDLLVARFEKTSISSEQLANATKSAEVRFTRDTSAQTTHAIVEEVTNNDNISHYTIDWINPNSTEEFCINLSGTQQWYSTYEEKLQRWPLDKTAKFATTAFSTFDFFQNQIGGIVENLWLSSSGFAVFVDRSAPLLLGRDTTGGTPLLCFTADYTKFPYSQAIDTKTTKLLIHLLSGTDVKQVLQYTNKLWINKPTGIPDERMIKSPIWSTWAEYKDDVTQTRVLDYAKQLNSYGLPNSQIEIDETWEIHYGDHVFNTTKFPNVKDMVSQLHNIGFRVTLWNTPFINDNSDSFKTQSKYLIKSKLHPNVTVTHSWWNGMGAMVDFTMPDARDWFVQRLKQLSNETGIDSYKFDAGEVGYVNSDFQFYNHTLQNTPSVLTQLYVETCAKLGPMIEVRVGYNSQHLPVFVRMLDKDSSWGYSNGLKTLIPTALTMSIAGYVFVLPDMIGGNAYGNFPNAELYIRWLQVNALMPTLQFSITPWDTRLGNNTMIQEVINATKKMLKLHEDYTPLLIELAKNAVSTGEPILRPLWWIAPNDDKTYTIDDEFLVGNDLLVAPVVVDGARKRNIYLPSGDWTDHKGVAHKGAQTLTDFAVALDELPYFVKK